MGNFHSSMLHQVLLDSIEGTLESHVVEWENRDKTKGNGAILLKMIQDKVRGKAVSQQMENVRKEIKQLKLKQCKWNISDFNARLKSLITTLRNNEEAFLDKDIMDVVVTNYSEVKHDDFATMVRIEKNDAAKRNQDIDWEALLELGEAKYEAMTASGDWGKKTPQEEQLFALQAQVRALQAAAEKSKGGPNTPPDSTNPPGSSKRNGQGRKKRNYEPWQFENPKNLKTLKKKVTIKGVETEVTYHWCLNHFKDNKPGMWVRHIPEECNNKDKQGGKGGKGGNDKSPPSLVANQTILDEN